MSNDMFLLDIPNFYPVYRNDTYYSYENEKGKENLKQLLTEASKGYCMYCYTKILVDRKNFGQLEHSIEKVNSIKLINCINNIAISCSKCNLSFKKKGQEKRKLTAKEIKRFEENSNCSVTCLERCSEYNKLRKDYIKKKAGKIILQPFGVRNEESGIDLLIQYDLLNQRFIPSNKYIYNLKEKKFIEDHIKRFNLNDCKYRTKEISIFCQDVLEYKNIPKAKRYSNLIVDLFIQKLDKIQLEKSIKICEVIYTQIIMKNKG